MKYRNVGCLPGMRQESGFPQKVRYFVRVIQHDSVPGVDCPHDPCRIFTDPIVIPTEPTRLPASGEKIDLCFDLS